MAGRSDGSKESEISVRQSGSPNGRLPSSIAAQDASPARSIESLQRQDRIRKLVGAAVQHRAGKGEEFLRHRLRVGKRGGLARGIGIEPLMHAVVGGDAETRAPNGWVRPISSRSSCTTSNLSASASPRRRRAGRNRPSRSGPGRARRRREEHRNWPPTIEVGCRLVAASPVSVMPLRCRPISTRLIWSGVRLCSRRIAISASSAAWV